MEHVKKKTHENDKILHEIERFDAGVFSVQGLLHRQGKVVGGCPEYPHQAGDICALWRSLIGYMNT